MLKVVDSPSSNSGEELLSDSRDSGVKILYRSPTLTWGDMDDTRMAPKSDFRTAPHSFILIATKHWLESTGPRISICTTRAGI